ncbi:hypothetical protein B0T14DRAFT_326954 [Immersiella caudata]|uniref:F-box domain-containing protein n=1 Tax=Immersiella caudata TaxID=314043 RepID=A0AA39WA87_9PEZI|nr:hypothetical protein B0T14DRAFT_326954 [Immersiella caudata]
MHTKTASKTDAPSARTRSKWAAELQRRQQILDSVASKPFGTLSALPAEILLSIINAQQLDIPTLVNIRLVNTHCKSLADSIPDYNFLSTTHPVVIRALSAAKAITPTCADVTAQLRAQRCVFCNDTAPPEDPNSTTNRGNRKFWSYFYLPTAELICLVCYRQGTTPFPLASGSEAHPPDIGRSLVPWSVANLRKRLIDPKREKQVDLDEYLDQIPRVSALPFIHHATRKPVVSPLQTKGLEFCDARAVKRLFNLTRPGFRRRGLLSIRR